MADTWGAPHGRTFGVFWAAYPQYANDTAATGPYYGEQFAVWHYTVWRALGPLADAYDARTRERLTATARLAAWNPATLAAGAFDRIAGTGAEDYDRFQASVVPYHAALQAIDFDNVFRNHLPAAAEYAARPRWAMDVHAPGGALVRHALLAAGGMLAAAAALAGAAAGRLGPRGLA